MRACVTVALAVVLCAACADAFSPHRAMKARGPVSPFPIEPLAPAPGRARSAVAVPQSNRYVEQAVTDYLQRWDWAGGATPFNPAPAMELYSTTPPVTPHIHALLREVGAAGLARVKFERMSAEQYAKAITTAYNTVASLRITEVPGTRKFKRHESLALVNGANSAKAGAVYEAHVKFTVEAKAKDGVTGTRSCRAKLFLTAAGAPAAGKYVIAKEELRVRAVAGPTVAAPSVPATVPAPATAASPAAAANGAKKP